MSYNKILNILQTKAIAGPRLAIGLRKPGQKRAIWLFGEGHSKDPDYGAEKNGFSVQDIVDIQDLLQTDNIGDISNTILVYEGIDPPGKRVFKDAPDNIKHEARLLTPELVILRKIGIEAFEHDEDGDLPEEPKSSELAEAGYNLDEVDDMLKENWEDPGYWDFVLDNVGEMTVAGEKFTSRGGISINIENKIRTLFVDTIRYHEEENKVIDVDSFFKVMLWALEDSMPVKMFRIFTKQNDVGNINIESLSRRSSHDLFSTLVKYINYKWKGTFSPDFLGEIVGEMLILLEDDPKTGLPFMLGEHKMRFVFLFIMVTMDMNIVPRMNENIKRDMVSYCGVNHTINQFIILHQEGYVVENTYYNQEMDFISPSSIKSNLKIFDVPLHDTLNFLKSILQ